MKIILLYTYNRGYLSSFFFELSTRLKKEGHDIVNFSLKHQKRFLLQDEIPIIIDKKGNYITNYFKIFNLLRKHQPDVVLSNFSYVNPALLFGKMLGVKQNIVWFHSLNNQMKPNKLKIVIKTAFLKLANIVIANSFLTKNELHVIYKVPKSKLRVLPFWTNISEKEIMIDKTKFVKNKSLLNIGCPGRLTEHKNQKIIIEALSILNQSSYRNFKLYFAGKGEDLNTLKKLTNQSNLSDKVSFLRHLTAEDMVIFYKEMDVIILPSLDEAFGLVFIEAISLGVPVIVSSKFGALTFIDNTEFNINDFSFNPEVVQELVDKLIPYFNNKNLSSNYFKHLHDATFDKEKIYQLVSKVLTTTT